MGILFLRNISLIKKWYILKLVKQYFLFKLKKYTLYKITIFQYFPINYLIIGNFNTSKK